MNAPFRSVYDTTFRNFASALLSQPFQPLIADVAEWNAARPDRHVTFQAALAAMSGISHTDTVERAKFCLRRDIAKQRAHRDADRLHYYDRNRLIATKQLLARIEMFEEQSDA